MVYNDKMVDSHQLYDVSQCTAQLEQTFLIGYFKFKINQSLLGLHPSNQM